MTEAQLQHMILARLNKLDGVRVWRANVGAARTATGGLVRFGVKGQADITGIIRGGRRIEIEVKAEKGRVSPDQLAFGAWITSLGGMWIVARSLDDALGPIEEALACSPSQ